MGRTADSKMFLKYKGRGSLNNSRMKARARAIQSQIWQPLMNRGNSGLFIKKYLNQAVCSGKKLPGTNGHSEFLLML
jgi:hypothetical protein